MISYVFYIAGRFFTHWGSWNWISIKLLKCKLVYFMEAEAQASCTMSMNKGVGVFDFAFGCTPTWQGLIALKTVKRFYFFSLFFLALFSCFSHVRLFMTPWTEACLAPLSMGFSRQGYWSGLSSPPPGDLHNPGIALQSPASPALQVYSALW